MASELLVYNDTTRPLPYGGGQIDAHSFVTATRTEIENDAQLQTYLRKGGLIRIVSITVKAKKVAPPEPTSTQKEPEPVPEQVPETETEQDGSQEDNQPEEVPSEDDQEEKTPKRKVRVKNKKGNGS